MWSFLGSRKGFGLSLTLSLAVLALDAMLYEAHQQPPVIVGLAHIGSLLFVLLSGIARCHELKWSGWRVLTFAIPVVGLVLALLLLLLPMHQPIDAGNSGIS